MRWKLQHMRWRSIKSSVWINENVSSRETHSLSSKCRKAAAAAFLHLGIRVIFFKLGEIIIKIFFGNADGGQCLRGRHTGGVHQIFCAG